MIHFCEYCNNMLYIKQKQSEDEDDSTEMFLYCKKCNNVREIESKESNTSSHKISSTNYNISESMYRQYINNDIIHDHTLPHVNNIDCENQYCTKPSDTMNDVIYIKYDHVNIKFLYCCVHCKTFWTT